MLVCSICEVAQVDDTDEAIDKDWLPSWWDKNDIEHEPCCPSCSQFLKQGESGEMELIPEIDCELVEYQL